MYIPFCHPAPSLPLSVHTRSFVMSHKRKLSSLTDMDDHSLATELNRGKNPLGEESNNSDRNDSNGKPLATNTHQGTGTRRVCIQEELSLFLLNELIVFVNMYDSICTYHLRVLPVSFLDFDVITYMNV